ncbi:MAG: hypothetical protein IT435_09820 [Phycisphaerales bacterium]|nr:hypothetical protein [Phycisphaerales bacterium]
MASASAHELRDQALLALMAGFGGEPDRLLRLHPRRRELGALARSGAGSLTRVLGAEVVGEGAALMSWVGIPVSGPVPLASALEYYLARRGLGAKQPRGRRGEGSA